MLIGLFLSAIRGQTYEFIIYAIRQRARADSSTVCYQLNIQKEQNKGPESYPNVSFMSTDQSKRERVPKRVIHAKKHNEWRKRLRHDIDQKTLESQKR